MKWNVCQLSIIVSSGAMSAMLMSRLRWQKWDDGSQFEV